jgi:hypothetical protein
LNAILNTEIKTTAWCLAICIALAPYIGLLSKPATYAHQCATLASYSWLPHGLRYQSLTLQRQQAQLMMLIMTLTLLIGLGLARSFLGVMPLWQLIGWCLGWMVMLNLYIRTVQLIYVIARQRQQRTSIGRYMALIFAVFILISCTALLIYKHFIQMQRMWMVSAIVLGLFMYICHHIRQQYRQTKRAIRQLDSIFANQPFGHNTRTLPMINTAKTAVFVVGSSRGSALHAILWVQRMFPMHFEQMIFMAAKPHSAAHSTNNTLQRKSMQLHLDYLVTFCQTNGIAATSYLHCDENPQHDVLDGLTHLAGIIQQDYPDAVFFSSQLLFKQDSILIRWLHHQATLSLQHRLHLASIHLLVLPIKI